MTESYAYRTLLSSSSPIAQPFRKWREIGLCEGLPIVSHLASQSNDEMGAALGTAGLVLTSDIRYYRPLFPQRLGP